MRQLEPQKKCGLEREIEREIIQDETEGQSLQKVEKSEHNPIREPLDIIVSSGGFDCSERQKCRKTPADEIRDGKGDGVDEDEKTEEGA